MDEFDFVGSKYCGDLDPTYGYELISVSPDTITDSTWDSSTGSITFNSVPSGRTEVTVTFKIKTEQSTGTLQDEVYTATLVIGHHTFTWDQAGSYNLPSSYVMMDVD